VTNAELLDLLREARVFVGFCPTTQEGIDRVCEVRDRIDAALAERQDSAKDVVEWKQYVAGGWSEAKIGADTLAAVGPFDHDWGTQWRWRVTREQGCVGYCATEAEAKDAAIAAARGTK
jgi:hypothetical protein